MMLIGSHSAAGEHGVLANTINGRASWRIFINDRAVCAAVASEQRRLPAKVDRRTPSRCEICLRQARDFSYLRRIAQPVGDTLLIAPYRLRL